MTGNHAAYVLGPLLPAWLAVALFSLGGLTFPIMAFLVVEGYRHTSNLRRYASRLLLFTLISQIPYSLLWGAAGNVLITLTLGLACVYAVDRVSSPVLKAAAVIVATLASAPCDWGVLGPLLICLFHVKRDEGSRGVAVCMALPLAVLGLPAMGYLVSLLNGQTLFFEPAASPSQVAMLANVGLPTIAHATLIGDAMLTLPASIVAMGEAGYALAGLPCAALLIMGYRERRGRPLKWFFYFYYPLHLFLLWAIGVVAYGG